MHQRTKMIAVARHWRKCTKKTTCISFKKRCSEKVGRSIFCLTNRTASSAKSNAAITSEGPALEIRYVHTHLSQRCAGSGEGQSDERPRTPEQAWLVQWGLRVGNSIVFGLSCGPNSFLLACLECVIAVTFDGESDKRNLHLQLPLPHSNLSVMASSITRIPSTVACPCCLSLDSALLWGSVWQARRL